MKLFSNDFYRSLVIGFLIGTAGMALSITSTQVRAADSVAAADSAQ